GSADVAAGAAGDATRPGTAGQILLRAADASAAARRTKACEHCSSRIAVRVRRRISHGHPAEYAALCICFYPLRVLKKRVRFLILREACFRRAPQSVSHWPLCCLCACCGSPWAAWPSARITLKKYLRQTLTAWACVTRRSAARLQHLRQAHSLNAPSLRLQMM